MSYIKDNFLLTNKTAEKLYFNYAKDMPIFDYHCHLSEKQILENKPFEDLFEILKGRQKPLALYIFSENRKNINSILENISFGGGCINDVVIHLATSEMGFGGVGESGMGSYHGKTGFDAFSHTKSIVDKKTFMDLPMRYQPYDRKINKKLLKLFLK